MTGLEFSTPAKPYIPSTKKSQVQKLPRPLGPKGPWARALGPARARGPARPGAAAGSAGIIGVGGGAFRKSRCLWGIVRSDFQKV